MNELKGATHKDLKDWQDMFADMGVPPKYGDSNTFYLVAMESLMYSHGPYAAMVLAKIQRFASMSKKNGRGLRSLAGKDRIAKELNMDEKTVKRHIDRLIFSGYLIDETPDRRGKAHILRPTYIERYEAMWVRAEIVSHRNVKQKRKNELRNAA